MYVKKHCEVVPRAMDGIFERSGRLRSNTPQEANLHTVGYASLHPRLLS